MGTIFECKQCLECNRILARASSESGTVYRLLSPQVVVVFHEEEAGGVPKTFPLWWKTEIENCCIVLDFPYRVTRITHASSKTVVVFSHPSSM